jgi:hypothetical protein
VKFKGARFFLVSIFVALVILIFAFMVFELIWIRIAVVIGLIFAIVKINGFLDKDEETGDDIKERPARYRATKSRSKKRGKKRSRASSTETETGKSVGEP